jgi:hypothetical protein
MNVPVVVLGCLALVGCLAHVVLGERYVIAPLRADALPASFLGDGDVTKRYLRWFWHVGSVAIGGGGVVLVFSAARCGPEAAALARVVALQYLSMFAMFMVVAVPRPVLFVRVPQGMLLGVGGALAWLAA